ncbi:response regulator [Pseudoxanthomonas sangjuensis]|uniref:response regulator n=1 Tax=Pseudoxanthomonas sangjuensis TaxID=1503750 RepID=UPI001390C205|nr:response regulator [Pseudoxanthomonas sangjuensis]KAF1707906.1 response regulator [Pseudoxanthomonas sangjuensis]
MERETKPRLLLVEDDPVSRDFLTAALEALPATVDTAATLAEATAAGAGCDLWLIDANLPDGSGAELLARLRRHAPRTPALAHTADGSPTTRERLLADGFVEVLVKPLSAGDLQAAVRETLGLAAGAPAGAAAPRDGTGLPLWDDAAALAALKGNAGNVAALRQLFLAELPKQRAAIAAAAANRDHEALHRELHRLKASCGFVGAARLQSAAAAFDRTLPDLSLLDEFDEIAKQTRL